MLGHGSTLKPPMSLRYLLAVVACFLVPIASQAAETGLRGVLINLPYTGVATEFLNGTGSFSTPVGGSSGSTNWVDVGTNSYTFGDVGIGTTPITAQKMTLRVDDLRTTPINGFFLTNATPATSGVQVQDSPAIYWSGGAWLTGSLSNAPVSFRSYVVPAGGATAPIATWTLDRSLNGAAYALPLTYDSAGRLVIPSDFTTGGAISSTGNILSGPSVFIGWSGRSMFGSSVLGALEANNISATARATLQANIPQVTKTVNYTVAAALDSGLEINNIGASAAVTNTLPTAVANQHYWAYVDAAQILSIKASGTDVIRWGSTVSAAAGDIWSSQVGSKLHIRSPKAGLWVVDGVAGAWTLVAPRIGNIALVSGTITVTNSTVTANSAVLLTRKTAGGTIGMSVTYTLNAGVGFTMTSDNVLDTSTYTWKLEEVPN